MFGITEGQKGAEWQVPPRETSGEHRAGWISELVQAGDRFVKGQQGIRHINDDIRLLMGHDQKNAVKSNGVWADYCTFIETISDISQIATLGAKADQWKKNVETYNGVFKYIFWDSHFLGATRKGLQWAALGRGYVGQKFSRMAGAGGLAKPKMHFPVYGPFDVLPEQLPMDNDIQGSYAVTIIEPMPIWEAHARFPDFQQFLDPISRYDWKTYGTALTENRLSFYDRWRFGSTGAQAGDWLSRYALGISEPIPTPTGWTKMGELKAGDYVYGGDGALCKVTVAHPIQSLESYKVVFNDGSEIVASADHQWFTSCKKSAGNNRTGEEKLRTTKEIFETLDSIHHIDAVALDMPEAWLPIDPYLLGLWLGDGCHRTGELTGLPEDLREIEKVLHSRGHKTTSFIERKIVSNFKGYANKPSVIARLRIEGFERALRTYGILRNKRIPMQYLRASFSQRLDLLRGLMDTDGWVTQRSRNTGEMASQCGWGQGGPHKELAEQTSELLNSLGIKNTFAPRIRKFGEREIIFHQTQLCPLVNVFNMPRKRDLQVMPVSPKAKSRYIVDVQPVGQRLVRCITVNSDDHTFLAGRSMIRTHNCEIRRTFVRDLSVNRSGRTLQMGTAGSSWGYVVPSVGDLLVSVNPFNGLPESRKATEEDCRIYPQLRMMISSPTVPVPMYDDTAFDWHGEIPVVQYDVNDVPWSPFGQSMIHSISSLERARRELLSLNDRTVKINTDPPIGWDYQSGVKPEQLTKLKLLESQGVRIGTKGDPGKALKSVLPEAMKTTEQNWKDLEVLTAQIKNDLGLTDIASLRELKMNMSGDNFEKFLENLGPIAKGLSRTIGAANGKHATMLMSNIAQYIPVSELVDMVGPKGIAIETYDNDPTSLVPGRLPGEIETGESKFHKRERAKWFLQKMKVVSTPEQLLNITQMQEQMRFMFLFQKGAKLPTKTYMEKFGITDYETQYDEWKNEQIEFAEWQLEVKALVAAKMKELGIEPEAEGGGKGQGAGGGRPNTNQKPHHAERKGSQDGKVRAVNSTS